MRKQTGIVLLFAAIIQAAPYIEANLQITDPQKEFGESLDRALFGGNVGLGWFFDPVPVAIGIDLAGLHMGTNTSTHNLLYSSNLVTVEQKIQSSAFAGHLTARIKPRRGVVRPYADGLFGFKSFTTNTSIVNSKDDTLGTSRNLSDNTISYGLRGGLAIHPKRKSPIGINLAAQYLWGGEASYLDASNPNCIVLKNEREYELRPLKSRTDMLTFSIGISFDLK